MSIQRSILGFVQSNSAISNQSKETQVESSLSSEVSCHHCAIDMSGTSSANSEFSSKRIDLTSTANQSSSVEVSESAHKQDNDLTSRANSDVSSEEWHVTIDSTHESSVETSCSSFSVTPETSRVQNFQRMYANLSVL